MKKSPLPASSLGWECIVVVPFKRDCVNVSIRRVDNEIDSIEIYRIPCPGTETTRQTLMYSLPLPWVLENYSRVRGKSVSY
jgi:hypothetical protein